jgi:hypothetical protein
MVRVNFKDDPEEMIKISQTQYCYRFNVKLVDGETKLSPANWKKTRIDETIYSNDRLRRTVGSSVGFIYKSNLEIALLSSNLQKILVMKQNAPVPSTSRHVEEARIPEQTEEIKETSDLSEEEEEVQKKSSPKKLPDHPALAVLPKRRLFKHKDPGSGKGLFISFNILATTCIYIKLYFLC